MSPGNPSSARTWRSRLAVPPPDSVGGGVLAVSVAFALFYLLLFVADYNRMTSPAIALLATSLSLVVALIPAFSLGSMLGTDLATFQGLELELARTVLAYSGSGTLPPSDAALAGVWRAHIAAAEESRRMARSHAYALGLFTFAGMSALLATLLAWLGTLTTTQNAVGLGMFFEWFAFAGLVAGAGAVVATVGYSSPVPGFDLLAARRWRRNAGRQQAIDGALSEVGWLSEFARSARETRLSTIGPSVIPAWRE